MSSTKIPEIAKIQVKMKAAMYIMAWIESTLFIFFQAMWSELLGEEWFGKVWSFKEPKIVRPMQMQILIIPKATIANKTT